MLREAGSNPSPNPNPNPNPDPNPNSNQVLREAGDARLMEQESVTALAPLRVHVVNPNAKQVGAAALDAFAGPMRVSPRLSANPYATKSLILSPPASTAVSALDAVSLTGATGQ